MELYEARDPRGLLGWPGELDIGELALICYPVWIHPCVTRMHLGARCVVGERTALGSTTMTPLDGRTSIIIGAGCVIGAGSVLRPGITVDPGALIPDGEVVNTSVAANEDMRREAERAREAIFAGLNDAEWFKLAVAEYRMMRWSGAADIYQRLNEKRERVEVLHNLALTLIAQGEAARGERMLRRCLELYPAYRDAITNLRLLAQNQAPGLALEPTESFIRTFY